MSGRRAVAVTGLVLVGVVVQVVVLSADLDERGASSDPVMAVLAGCLVVGGVAAVVGWLRLGSDTWFGLLTCGVWFTAGGLQALADLAREGVLHDVLDVVAILPLVAFLVGFGAWGLRELRARRADV